MYRRRRPKREPIVFGFDSFLDIVANVIGIIIRLILVTWVGARSYHAAMEWVDPQTHTSPMHTSPTRERGTPKISDDPLHSQVETTKSAAEAVRARLLEQLRRLELAKTTTTKTQASVAQLRTEALKLDNERKELEDSLEAKESVSQTATQSMKQLEERSQALIKEMQALEKSPLKKKELRYHTPVSRVVQAEEVFFECRGGKVTFIDMPAFLHEVRRDMQDISELLQKEPKITRTTAAVGPFRLRYTFEREQGILSAPGGGFRYGLSGWTVEPVTSQRGEDQEAALKPNSQFRRMADALDPNQSVATIWVYPDSFELFRRLRDFLYERDIEVAGRPLPYGADIAGSRKGTRSRGQ
ncbi:MAG: hypothetical protein L0Y72_04325 [Gemmataceae bacterium]|nr:hypothetical protein [Gemmataceae bacterium]MCI0738246.1 hypothetical protein [Gemmataceae bacterium]